MPETQLPSTTWLGQGNPIFGGRDATPQYNPFNMNMGNGPFGQMANIAGPMLLQQFMAGTGRAPYQFAPAQGLYDQQVARQFYEGQQQAMAIASRRDQAQLATTLHGIGRLWEGRELTPAEIARNVGTAGMFSRFMPLAVQIFGPDMVDQLHGARGSATLMAHQMHSAMRTAVDPLTGRVGMSGQSSGMISQEVYERLFGQNANLAAMRGITAGQSGILANELQSRGMLGNIGQLGPNAMADIRSRGAGFYDDAFIARAADRDPAIQAILASGGTPTARDYATAHAGVRSTRDRALAPGGGLSAQGLEGMPGGADMLRAGDAHVISQRLESLSGVVSAMREIFGDMGNPNAPMHELINGLQNLTQGGLSQMSPGELEAMVRRTQAIARQTGVGMQGMIALSTQAGAFGDQLGLHRSFAPFAAQQSALYGGAARATQRLDLPVWNSMDLEQVTLADMRMRSLGAASPLGNNLNAMMNMASQGMIPDAAAGAAPTRSQAIVAAIRAGAREYSWGGQTSSLQMNREQLLQLVTGEHGVSDTTARAIFNDRMGNQQFSSLTNTSIRGVQGFDAARMLGGAYAGVLGGNLIAAGMNPEQARVFAEGVGLGVATDYIALPDAVARDTGLLRTAQVDHLRDRIRRQVIAQGTPAANVNSETERIIAGLGGESGLARMAGGLTASGNTVTAGTLYRSQEGLRQTFSPRTLDEMRRHAGQAETSRITAGSLAGIGTTQPLARLVDALSQARPGQDLREMMSDVLGGISQSAVSAADPHGIVSAMTDLVSINSNYDANNPLHRPIIDRNAAIIRGLSMGGQHAQDAIDQYQYDASVSGPTMAALAAASRSNSAGGAAILNAMPTGYDSGAIADRLIAAMPYDQQNSPGFANPWSRLRLVTEIGRGGRGSAIHTALRAQDQLVNLAVDRGLYGADATAEGLGPEQRLRAGSLLRDARANGTAFSAQNINDIDLWTRQSLPLQTLGRGGTAQAVEDAVRVIRGFGDATAPGAAGGAGAAGTQITRWTGEFELRDNRAIVTARPADTVANLTGNA